MYSVTVGAPQVENLENYCGALEVVYLSTIRVSGRLTHRLRNVASISCEGLVLPKAVVNAVEVVVDY